MVTASNAATAAENKPVYNSYIIQKESEVVRRLTKVSIPSAYPFQLSVIARSSFLALVRYIENRGSEPSEKLDSPGRAWPCWSSTEVRTQRPLCMNDSPHLGPAL